MDEYAKILNMLPKWDKTPFWAKEADIGDTVVYETESGMPAKNPKEYPTKWGEKE